PGVTDIGNHCYDCSTIIALPFTYNLYGRAYNNATVTSSGKVGFQTADPNGGSESNCLPDPPSSYAIFPHWYNQDTSLAGGGIFISVSGSAPNRIFNIEWKTWTPIGSPHYELRLYEGQDRFDIVYGPPLPDNLLGVG